MKPQQYLENKLKSCASYKLSPQEEDVRTIDIKNFLFKLITRKKFRRWKLPDLARGRIDKTLDFCLLNKEPIIFRFRFGGYKLW